MTADRCQHGLPVDSAGPFDLSQCRPCWVAGGGDKSAAVVSVTCRHLGARVDRPGQVREWRECGHPARPLGEMVCRCKGCGPKCSGYTPGEAD